MNQIVCFLRGWTVKKVNKISAILNWTTYGHKKQKLSTGSEVSWSFFLMHIKYWIFDIAKIKLNYIYIVDQM